MFKQSFFIVVFGATTLFAPKPNKLPFAPHVPPVEDCSSEIVPHSPRSQRALSNSATMTDSTRPFITSAIAISCIFLLAFKATQKA
jgi:hypothetical protein